MEIEYQSGWLWRLNTKVVGYAPSIRKVTMIYLTEISMKQIVLRFAVQFLIEQPYTKTLYFLFGQILESLLDLNQLNARTKQNSIPS